MDILQKWHRTRDKTSYFVRWEGDHRPLAKTAKVMHKGKRRCCTASSFFMFQPSFHASQNPRLKSRVPKMCPKSCFSPKNGDRKGFWAKCSEALFFNGREGGIRTHGGSSPHLISSQAPSTTRTPLHAAVRQVALYHRSECMARNFSALYAKGQIASLIVARSR